MIASLFRRASARGRAKRAEMFRTQFCLDETTTVLDLGSEAGASIHTVLAGTRVRPGNVYIADIDAAAVAEGHARFGFNPIVIEEAGRLPFPDQFFDIVHCSSVIEHVTVPKGEIWQLRDGREFKARARAHQREFSEEIQRLGRHYFVQTPNVRYPIESHSWLPIVGQLPRRLQLPTLRFTNRVWVKQTEPDWCLFNGREFADLFPGATLLKETTLGLTKSFMVVR